MFSAVAGWLLSLVGFQANVEQTAEVRHGLVLLVSLIPAAMGLLSIGLVLFYPLSEEKMERITADLEQRRAAGGEATAAPRS